MASGILMFFNYLFGLRANKVTIGTLLQKEQTLQLGSLLSVSKCSMQNFYGGLLKGQWNCKLKEKSECC